MQKLFSSILVIVFLMTSYLPNVLALDTNNQASPWTREKAMHLARSVLFQASGPTVDTLYNAGSASAAIDILFPSVEGPDRSEYDTFLSNYTSSGFNWGDANHVIRRYQLVYSLDPYEAKRKLFSLFEDIFAVNNDSGKDITYRDVTDMHDLIYVNMFGNYQTLVKKVLSNNGGKGDYAEGAFLDLFNQNNPKQPNENYARELLQLFLMGEYEPGESKDNNDPRNYEEADVRALAKILTGLRADKLTHAISFDPSYHYKDSTLEFLSGAYDGIAPTYYNTASGTIDPILILDPVNGNNGLTDNAIEYIFAKRADKIALFLADRIARFYMQDVPARADIDSIAAIIKINNFNMYVSIKQILALDSMYSDATMNSIRYKNPLELTIGTIRLLRENNFSKIVGDINVYDTNLLRRLGWTPYFAGSVFGRDGFDSSYKWLSTSTQSAWMNATNYFTYRTTGTGIVDFYSILPSGQYHEILNEAIPLMTGNNTSFSGMIQILSGTLDIVPLSTTIKSASFKSFSLEETAAFLGDGFSIEEQIAQNGFSLDPIQAIETGENLLMTPAEPIEFSPEISTLFFSAPVVSTGFIIEFPKEQEVQVFSTIIENTSLSLSGESTVASGTTIISDVGLTQTGVVDIATINTGSISLLPIVELTGSTISSTGDIMSVQTGTIVDTSLSGNTDTGGVIDIDSIASNDQSPTDTASLKIANLSEVLPLDTISGSTLIIGTGNVMFPQFRIMTDMGIITLSGGTYDGLTKTISITAGIFTTNTGAQFAIASGTLSVAPNSILFADTIKAESIIDTYELFLFGDKRLSSDVRMFLVDFLTQDASGNPILVAPTNTVYFNTYIRGMLSIMLAQPEYVMLHGYDIPTSNGDGQTNLFDTVTGKLLFIELYGGNDYLSSIIPKDEYDTYVNNRTISSGSIALTGSDLVDIGDNYMNVNLAYGSGGAPGFKDLYDQGYLKLFNRVGGYKHSNDHDAAAKQITSYDSTTSLSAEGAFGHLVKNELESTHTISLGAKLPNIYRAGRYVNLGGNVILSNPLNGGGQWTRHMNIMQDITLSRVYPGDTQNLFRDTGKISEIGKTSVAQGGAPGASGNMTSVLDFTKILMNNNIGRTFYMGGAGGYDTHGNQRIGLNTNLRTVSSAVTTFFNAIKDTQDITIVIFSEFGRTNFTNGDLGTDHGDGGGMYVLTSNPKLRSELGLGSYGNMSIQYAKNNSLGIGIDYRSVYGVIFKNLYNLDPSTYFQSPIDLLQDVSMTPNKISLLSRSYQMSGQNVILSTELSVSGSNFDPGKAGYVRVLTNTGNTNEKITRLSPIGTKKPEGYTYAFSINPNTQSFYTLQTFSNQYSINSFVGTHTGIMLPNIIPNTSRTISQTKNSLLTFFGNTTAPSKLSGSGIILEATGAHVLTIPENSDIHLHFHSGVTTVTDLTYTSGSTAWRGGFILGEDIAPSLFLPDTARMSENNGLIPHQNIARILKIGADKRGVGMRLNQAIGIEFSGLKTGESYRIITSEDGIVWSDLEMGNKEYIVSASGSVYAETNHFSYFALLSSLAVINPPPLPLPSCTISASTQNVQNGSGTLLSWNIQNTNTGILNPISAIVANSGTLFVTPPISTTTSYVLNISNPSGIASCSVSVTATATPVLPPVLPLPICTITATPQSVTNGSGTMLVWSIQNANTGVINPGNLIVASTGTTFVIPGIDSITSYVLTATNSSGTSSCSVNVSAAPVPPIVPIALPPTCSISANTMVTMNGSGIILLWSLQNVATGILSPFSTVIPQTGTIFVTPASSMTTTYSITVSNAAGSTSCNTQITAVSGTGTGTGTGTTTPVSTPVASQTLVGPGGGGGGSASSSLAPSVDDDIMDTNMSESTVSSMGSRIAQYISQITSIAYSNKDAFHTSYGVGLSGRLWKNIVDFTGDKELYKEEILSYLLTEKENNADKNTLWLDRVIGFISRIDTSNLSHYTKDAISNPPYLDTDTRPSVIAESGIRYIAVDNSVNLRTTPVISELNILRSLSRNTPVTVLKVEGAWSLVDDGNGEGYIKTSLLRDHVSTDDIRAGKVSVASTIDAKVIAPQSVYMRQSSSISSKIVTTLMRDEGVVILDSVGKWFEVMTEKYRGFVSKKYIRVLTAR